LIRLIETFPEMLRSLRRSFKQHPMKGMRYPSLWLVLRLWWHGLLEIRTVSKPFNEDEYWNKAMASMRNEQQPFVHRPMAFIDPANFSQLEMQVAAAYSDKQMLDQLQKAETTIFAVAEARIGKIDPLTLHQWLTGNVPCSNASSTGGAARHQLQAQPLSSP
jgi:hypothetical protein